MCNGVKAFSCARQNFKDEKFRYFYIRRCRCIKRCQKIIEVSHFEFFLKVDSYSDVLKNRYENNGQKFARETFLNFS